MIGVTFFGVLFTPIFFSVLMKMFGGKDGPGREEHSSHSVDEEKQMVGAGEK
jgi:hypothetical protein